MKYPFVAEEPELRTHASHIFNVAKVIDRGLFFRGVKGESAFMNLVNIDMAWDFPLYYLHNAILGATEQVWTSWNRMLSHPLNVN